MSDKIFPYTQREANLAGVTYSSEYNRSCKFPRRLAQLRTEAGLSQQKLADLLNVSKSTISLYEVGDTVPDAKMIVRMCEIFGVSTDYFLCQSDYKTAESAEMTASELGLTEEAALNIQAITSHVLPNEKALPYSRAATLNRLFEHEEIYDFVDFLCAYYKWTVTGSFLANTTDIFDQTDLFLEHSRLLGFGEVAVTMKSAAELYLQRTCDTLRKIAHDYSAEKEEETTKILEKNDITGMYLAL